MKRNAVLNRIGQVLERRRNALRRSVSEGLRSADAGASHPVGDEIDAASDAAHGELSWHLIEAESRELASIENALERLRNGEYGRCEECDGAIPAARLNALPYATLCIKCQREAEREPSGSGAAGDWSRVVDLSDVDVTPDPAELSA
ncbi:MAG: TraR/DksA family transcriptional regulator [Pirellulaceae bacterium]